MEGWKDIGSVSGEFDGRCCALRLGWWNRRYTINKSIAEGRYKCRAEVLVFIPQIDEPVQFLLMLRAIVESSGRREQAREYKFPCGRKFSVLVPSCNMIQHVIYDIQQM